MKHRKRSYSLFFAWVMVVDVLLLLLLMGRIRTVESFSSVASSSLASFIPRPIGENQRLSTSFTTDSSKTTTTCFTTATRAVKWRLPSHQHQFIDNNKRYSVGICGAGAIGLANAAMLEHAGHVCTLWSPHLSTQDDNDDNLDLTSVGALEFSCRPHVAKSLVELVQYNDIILIALPAYGHKSVMDQLAPLLQPGRHAVIISSHASLGALYLAQLLQQQQQKHKSQQSNPHAPATSATIPIIAWGTTVCTARKLSPHSVNVHTIRQTVDLYGIPGLPTFGQLDQEPLVQLCRTLYPQVPQFVTRDSLLSISLSNLNPQNHLAMALPNFSRLEQQEAWYQFQSVTPHVGRFLERLDEERLSIARAWGVQSSKTVFQHFQQGFHVNNNDKDNQPYETLSDVCQAIYEQGRDVYGPITADTRFVTEDAPFGLALTVQLGHLADTPAVLHQAGLTIFSAMYGRDFAAENDLLAALNLSQYTLEELQRGATSGVLEKSRSEQQQPQMRHDQPRTPLSSESTIGHGHSTSSSLPRNVYQIN